VRQRLGLSFYRPVQIARRVELHGDPEYGGWRICPDGVGAQSVVYDVGVGEDLSFAASLIRTYGLRVWAFDPTPRSIEWVERQPRSPELRFQPCGIAEFDGAATLYLPDDPRFVSGTLIRDGHHRGGAHRVLVKRVATVMAELGHRRVDILKLDIEGAEYGVLHDVLRSGLDVEQILVEFHRAPGSADYAPAAAAIQELNRHGYRIFAVGHGTDFSLIRTSGPDRRT
jgi:FkbM family methyltransferase